MNRRRLLLAACAGLLPLPAASAPRVPAVTLLDHLGRPCRLDALVAHRPVAVGFFYVACTTVCPPQTANLMFLRDELTRRGGAPESPLLLSISLDPLGDTPQAMGDYAARFGIELGLDQGWMMLTGAWPALSEVWAAFDVASGPPEQHAAVLWLGGGGRRWQRASALSPAAALADQMLRGPV